MPKPCKVKYDPSLSVLENAAINEVSIADIRYYIKTRNIDRNYDNKLLLIKRCQAYLKKNPKGLSNLSQMSRDLTDEWKEEHAEKITKTIEKKICKIEPKYKRYDVKISRLAIHDIIKYLNGEAILELNQNKARARQEVLFDNPNVNKKRLMSAIMAEVPQVFAKADEQDVSALSLFLRKEAENPILFIGSGGMSGTFPSLLYSMNKGLGQVITPYTFNSLSDDAIKNSRCMLITESGNDIDVVYAAERCTAINPVGTACFTFLKEGNENKTAGILKANGSKVFAFPNPKEVDEEEGFISIKAKFYKDALFYRAYIKGRIAHIPPFESEPSKCFEYRLNDNSPYLPPLKSINHIIALHGGFGEPVARDLESAFAEIGLVSVQMVDYRNFCHGRFIFVGNHTKNDDEPREESDVAIMLLVSPREEHIANLLMNNVIPPKTPIIIIRTEFDSPMATMDLMYKSNIFISYIGERCYGINPNSPENYSRIDKRYPKGGVNFKKEFKKWGRLQYNDDHLPK